MEKKTFKVKYTTGTSRHDVKTYSTTIEALTFIEACTRAVSLANNKGGVMLSIECITPRF